MGEPARILPPWAEELRARYLRGEAWQFVLHGAVHDLVVHERRLVPVPDLLAEGLLAPTKELVVHYDLSSGVRVVRGDRTAPTLSALLGQRAPSEVLAELERLLLSRDRVGVVIEYAETIAPAAETSFSTQADRAAVVALHRWSMSPVLERADNVVVLLCESLTELHPRLSANPRTATVLVPMPDEAARSAAIALLAPGLDPPLAARLTAATAGLKILQLKALLLPDPRDAAPDGEALLREVARRKKEIIERECAGLVELLEPRHDFSAVGGLEPVKAELKAIANNLRAGRRARCPMGILFTGPMGTGKTFVAEAFAREAGLPALKMKGFRSKWVGATEANLERILAVVRAMGPVIVIIDEVERALGGEEGESDGGTSSRVMARLKEFMADTEIRGRVVFVVMTNRPDKLDADLKRAGRLDRKIPFFPPQDAEEVEPVLLALLRRHQLDHALEFPRDRAAGSAPLCGYSQAEIEQVILLAAERAGGPVTPAEIAAAIHDFLPSRDRDMLDYMELVSVFEASNRRLLPRRWAVLDTEALQEQLSVLKARVGARR
ncbi:MAG TPA: ATP-binding protein [Anaeromyxobacter sp.]|nr:ATP-binding protein [Anaeromyxobacter sp.]